MNACPQNNSGATADTAQFLPKSPENPQKIRRMASVGL
jgi:hypothetical protein